MTNNFYHNRPLPYFVITKSLYNAYLARQTVVATQPDKNSFETFHQTVLRSQQLENLAKLA